MRKTVGRSGERTTPKDVFLSEVKTRDVFPLLILHIVREEPAYGNSIMARIREISAGTMSVSPNTIYPLLRRLEEKGYVEGEWERPDTRSRRFYKITGRGEDRKSTRLNSSHANISYVVFCLKKYQPVVHRIH